MTARDGWVAVVYAKDGEVSMRGNVRQTRAEASLDLEALKIDSKLFRKEVRHSRFAEEKRPWTTSKERERKEKRRLDRRMKRKAARLLVAKAGDRK